MENKSQIENALFDFINKNSLNGTKEIKTNTLIFKEGIFDSMGFVLLVDFIEESFKIETSDTDLVEENFRSITAIADFIIMKQIKSTTYI